MLVTTRIARYLGALTAKTAYTLSAGRVALSTLTTAHERPVSLGGVDNLLRGFEVQIIGTGADDSTINLKLWRVRRSASRVDGTQPVTASLELLGTAVATLSTATLASGDDLLASGETYTAMRIADTIVWTTGGIEAAMNVAVGSGGINASGVVANTPATLFVPDLGGADALLIEFDLGTATGADALISGYR